MNGFKSVVASSLFALCACGNPVEVGDAGDASPIPSAGKGGKGGAGGGSGRGGRGGTGAGDSGTLRDGGTNHDAGSDDDVGTERDSGGVSGVTVAPTVVSTDPASGAPNVDVDTRVSVVFSESMNPATIRPATFTLMQGSTPVTGNVTRANTTAMFTPANPLADETVYTATISTRVTDLAGNALASAAVWTFTTGDRTRPSVVTTSPAGGDTRVALNKRITASFDEALDDSSVTITSFTVKAPTGPALDGAVSYDDTGKVATFVPSLNLQPSTTYTVTITTAVTDASGNALAQDKVWTFMTGTTAAQLVEQIQVPLGAASSFVILASAAISNIPTSRYTGNIGLSPAGGASITGFSSPATCPEVIGKMYVVDATGPACAVIDPVMITNAKLAAQVAYVNATAAVRGTPQAISGNLNGLTLYPGLYESGSSLEISPGGFLYLDAQGDSSAVFIIRSATSITTQDTSAVVLTKGAKANNVYWTAGSAITLGTRSIMKGTMIAGTALSLLTGANLEGRALNQGPAAAAISLDKSTIALPAP